MIAWGDIYKVVEAMAPLYFALGLGYGSVRWWRFFAPEQCGAINTLAVHLSMPFYNFDFAARTDPYSMNNRVIAADAVSKALAIVAVAAWAARTKAGGGARSWWTSITGFSFAALNNTLVVGAPLLDAMYGKWAVDLIVQIAVVQGLVWFPLLLLLAFELRNAWIGFESPLPTTAASDLEMEAQGIRLWPIVKTMTWCVPPKIYIGPVATLVGAVALGLRGDVLRLAIIQCSLVLAYCAVLGIV
ncbi:hypothetical protein EJB05_53660, partial [Eragrostis curvula]